MPPTWYGLTPDLRIGEDGPVTLEEALSRARDCIRRVQPYYAHGEDALAATTFGLSYARRHFVEFCVHAVDQISMHFIVPGVPWYRRLFRGRRAHWRTLRSPEEVSQAIKAFFAQSSAELDAALRKVGAA